MISLKYDHTINLGQISRTRECAGADTRVVGVRWRCRLKCTVVGRLVITIIPGFTMFDFSSEPSIKTPVYRTEGTRQNRVSIPNEHSICHAAFKRRAHYIRRTVIEHGLVEGRLHLHIDKDSGFEIVVPLQANIGLDNWNEILRLTYERIPGCSDRGSARMHIERKVNLLLELNTANGLGALSASHPPSNFPWVCLVPRSRMFASMTRSLGCCALTSISSGERHFAKRAPAARYSAHLAARESRPCITVDPL